ncbi:MAG: hypothetical protein F4X40_02150 [Chloroflexi bacterium]|nr:hypothetical protein [Chloroflexota bacterium]
MFGYDSQSWKLAETQVYELLVKQARACERITYSDLVQQIDAIGLDMGTDKDRAALGWLLGSASVRSHEERAVMVSAMAVLSGSRLPSSGFYDLAVELGYEFSDREIFWGQQYEAVIEHYSQ